MGYLGNSIASDGGSSKIAVFVVTKDGVIRRRAIIRSIVSSSSSRASYA